MDTKMHRIIQDCKVLQLYPNFINNMWALVFNILASELPEYELTKNGKNWFATNKKYLLSVTPNYRTLIKEIHKNSHKEGFIDTLWSSLEKYKCHQISNILSNIVLKISSTGASSYVTPTGELITINTQQNVPCENDCVPWSKNMMGKIVSITFPYGLIFEFWGNCRFHVFLPQQNKWLPHSCLFIAGFGRGQDLELPKPMAWHIKKIFYAQNRDPVLRI